MSELASSRPVFVILSALVEERAGLHYGPAEREIFLEKVGTRALEAGFPSLLDYYYFLRYDPEGSEELEKLVESLVIHETYFFREFEPLQVLVQRLVAPLVREGKRPRIWSAACATGEEPLTLAMLLAEAKLLGKVDLIASDISARVLERAQAGRFNRRSLRDVPDVGLAQRWTKEESSGLTVAPELRAAITWKQVNLCEPAELKTVGPCDFILCRNVLIYFSDETTVQVMQGLSQALRPGGALLVGVSESLLRFGTSLACQEENHVFFYRKVS